MNDIAWAAGLFEGEGSVRYEGKRQHTLYLSMGSADKDVIDRFVAIVGGHVKGPYRGQGRKTPAHYKLMYQWQMAGLRQVTEILDAFWPYLGERRRAKAADSIADYYLDPHKRMPQRRNGRSALSLIGA